ncbi:MAG: ABC transporter substrate-binding protein [Rikenellaceae bacterium]
MKRFISILCIGLFFSLLTLQTFAAPRENTLKIYNWADYIDEGLVDEFVIWYKEQTGEDVSIIYQTYDLNEVALAKIERAKADYDLICPSDYIIERMINMELLLPIDKDFGTTPNYIDNVSPYMNERFRVMNRPGMDVCDYATPYMWSTMGLLYNTRTVTREEVQSWGILWDTKYKNRILMKDDSRHIYGLTRLYINQDKIAEGELLEDIANDNSQEAIDQVEKALTLVRSNIAGFEMDFGKEMMTKEKADISIQYLGDAVWARREGAEMGVKLDFVVPTEGSIMFIDAWVIPKYAENVKAASYFINFMCRPDNAVRNMDYVGYLSTVASTEALKYIHDDEAEHTLDLSYFFADEDGAYVNCDPLMFPSQSDVDSSVIMRDFGDNTESIMVMWATVKGDNLNPTIVIIIIATILLFTIFYTRKYIITQRTRRRYQERFLNTK